LKLGEINYFHIYRFLKILIIDKLSSELLNKIVNKLGRDNLNVEMEMGSDQIMV
jgi:hypothetical protein